MIDRKKAKKCEQIKSLKTSNKTEVIIFMLQVFDYSMF
jgi:hypothetical protein